MPAFYLIVGFAAIAFWIKICAMPVIRQIGKKTTRTINRDIQVAKEEDNINDDEERFW